MPAVNLQRIMFGIVLGLQAALAGAIGNNTFPTYTPYLLLLALFVAQVVQALTNSIAIPPSNPASKVAFSRRVPPLPLLVLSALLALVLGCSWLSSPSGAQTVGLVAKDVLCVLDHDNEPIAKIVSDCSLVGDVTEEVTAIANASRARRGACLATDAGPGK